MMDRESSWVTAWASTPQPTEDADMPPYPFTQPEVAFQNTTIRQTVRITAGGESVRIRVSNDFAFSSLGISRVTIALPQPCEVGGLCGSHAIRQETLQQVLFDGETRVSVPEGSHITSDSVKFPVKQGQILSISIYLQEGHSSHQITSHPGSRTDSWLCHDDHTMSGSLTGPDLHSVTHWYFLSGVEVWQPSSRGTLVLLGDSITDGRCSTDNANNRWPDIMFNYMQSHPFARNITVVNQAVGGGRVLRDGKGPSLLRRLDRDALAQPGRRYILIFHGINDLGTADSNPSSLEAVQKALKQGYRQIASRCHAHGLPVFGATIGPMGGNDAYGTCDLREKTRQEVNEWIRTTGVFDAVVDFDAVLRSSEDQSRLRAEFDSGDHLHPNVAAFEAMAAAFPIEVFEKFNR